MSIDKPCKDCQERFVGCHSSCEKYAEMRRQIDEFNEKKNKIVAERNATVQYCMGVRDRTTRQNYNYLFKKNKRSRKK